MKRDDLCVVLDRDRRFRVYALATMTEIAAELDLRDATLYYYFPSKQALFYACHLQSADRFKHILEMSEREGVNGAERLDRFFFHLVDESARDGPMLYFGDYFHLEAEQRVHVAQLVDEFTARLENFLKLGVEDGSIVPCETGLVVQLLLGMLIWLAKWVPGVEGLTAERLVSAMDSFSLHGLRNRPD